MLIDGISLETIGNNVIVSIHTQDGEKIPVIKEYADIRESIISHHISNSGLISEVWKHRNPKEWDSINPTGNG